jgi:hypothetical protein
MGIEYLELIMTVSFCSLRILFSFENDTELRCHFGDRSVSVAGMRCLGLWHLARGSEQWSVFQDSMGIAEELCHLETKSVQFGFEIAVRTTLVCFDQSTGTTVRMYVRTYIRTYVCTYVRTYVRGSRTVLVGTRCWYVPRYQVLSVVNICIRRGDRLGRFEEFVLIGYKLSLLTSIIK